MSKKRGLSMEEKKQKVLEIFYETKEFYRLKELEKIAPKEKGVVVQSVKDVLQALVDDGLVDTDKIGTSIYFWAFPSKATVTRQAKLESLTKKVEDVKQKRKTVTDQLEQAKKAKTESGDCEDLLEELKSLKEKRDTMKKDLQQQKDCDPTALEDTTKQTQVCKEAANRWTDNLFSMKAWCRDKFNVEEDVLNKQFDIPEDLDYIS